MVIRRPILVIGVGLSFGLWFWDSLSHSSSELGNTTFWSLIAVGAGVWWWQQQKNSAPTLDWVPDTVGRETAEKVITEAEAVIQQLVKEAGTDQTSEMSGKIATLQQRVTRLTTALDEKNLKIELIGTKNTGKSTLIQQLQLWQSEQSSEFPGIQWQETVWNQVTDETISEINFPQLDSDLVLLVLTGDITDSEYQLLTELKAKSQRFLLIWNKQDQYLPAEKLQILQKLRQTLQGVLSPEDVVAISCSPNPIKVRKHQENGQVDEWVEKQNPELESLTTRLGQVLAIEGQSLIWARIIRQGRQLKAEAKEILNLVRKNRALPMIEQYQWMAAGAAFANPVPALDLLATAAINAQLVVDLGEIYQQKFSLEQGKTVAGTLATQMLKLGVVELSTKTLGVLLKSHAVTFVAGGVLQGVSAAYLTRMAGLSLVEYFQAQEVPITAEDVNSNDLGKTLQRVFEKTQQASVLQGLVQKVLGRLSPENRAPELSH